MLMTDHWNHLFFRKIIFTKFIFSHSVDYSLSLDLDFT
jgi:hypothetical protein